MALYKGTWQRNFVCKYLTLPKSPAIPPKLALLCQFKAQNMVLLWKLIANLTPMYIYTHLLALVTEMHVFLYWTLLAVQWKLITTGKNNNFLASEWPARKEVCMPMRKVFKFRSKISFCSLFHMCELQDLEQSAFFDCFQCLSEEEPSTAFRFKAWKLTS